MSDLDGWGVGDQVDAAPFDKAKLGEADVDLITGQFKHSYTSNTTYARTEGGTIYEFDGHRRLIDVQIKSGNYLKESDLSGDEIRKECMGYIYSDGIQVYEFFNREPLDALLHAHRLIQDLQGNTSNWLSERDREKLVGRKIFYHDQPATISRLIVDQGCVMITTEPGFKPPTHSDDEEEDDWLDWKVGDHYEVKDDVLSPHIWWFRD